jgi:acetyl esterase/lipase
MPLDPQLRVMLEQAAARAAASDEGAAYAERLAAAGVPVSYLAGDGLTHGFLYYPRVSPACAAARDAFAAAICAFLGQHDPVSSAHGAQKGREHVG